MERMSFFFVAHMFCFGKNQPGQAGSFEWFQVDRSIHRDLRLFFFQEVTKIIQETKSPCEKTIKWAPFLVAFLLSPTMKSLWATNHIYVWFDIFVCLPLPGKMIQFDQYFSNGLVQPPTN